MFTQSKLSIAPPTCTHGRFLRFAPNLNFQLSSDRPASVAMTEPRPIFSESWHRVAQLRLGLRSSIVTHRQRFRGEPWIVVQNHFTNEFFRLRPAAWEFVARLEGRTVDEAWRAVVERDADEAPGQDEALGLLAQLSQANLLQSDVPADTAKLFARYKARRQREVGSKLMNLMAVRVPLWDPDAFLRRVLPFASWLFGPLGVVLWGIVVAVAAKVAIDHAGELREQGEGVLAPSNLALLYVALAGIKAVHEFGHAIACRRFGGEVHTLGVLFYLFTPLPFVNATASWGFRSKWQRILVAAAGMIAELFVAALALFVWSLSAPGVVHSLAYNVVVVASVTTLLFNANPLVRYDGYYIFSDWLEAPNLQARSAAMLRYLAERFAFGCRRSENPAHTRGEAVWLGVYGSVSWIYRIFLFSRIILFVADKYLVFGLIMAVSAFVGWILRPVWGFIHYLAFSPRLLRVRKRAVAVSAVAGAAALLLLAVVPAPNHFRAPGVVQARHFSDVFAPSSGSIAEALSPPGAFVKEGQPLVRMKNPELDLNLAAAEAELAGAKAQFQDALSTQAAEIGPLKEHVEALESRRNLLVAEIAALTIRAVQDGVWFAPQLAESRGSWAAKGAWLGRLVDGSRFEFRAVVSQDDAANLFSRGIRRADVRLATLAAEALPAGDFRITPAEQERLPSAALGWRGGGEIAVTDRNGLKAVEGFFEISALLEPSAAVPLRQGETGKIRFALRPEPLLWQWEGRVRQLLQRRFSL
jgi:putative peptide zinc metalloprotease protein